MFIMTQNAAIFILTQNTDVRRTYLKTTLYFLFKHFNAQFKYPVIILHEGDYDHTAQREILMGIRESCRSLVSFVALDSQDFDIPDHVDRDKMDACIATKAVPYWRTARYRLMCRWWMVHMLKYAKGYDYIMRIDDDSIIEEPVEHDLFEWMAANDLVYSSAMVHVDCGICNMGMKEFFDERFPDKKDTIQKMFQPSEIPLTAPHFHPFRKLLSVMHGDSIPLREKLQTWMPIIYYNNFFITKTAFWMQDDVQQTIDAVDRHGGIYYYRWGDAPMQTIIMHLFAKPEQIKRAMFRYSKRLQREAFLDDIGMYHSYMPPTYDLTSCVVTDCPPTPNRAVS